MSKSKAKNTKKKIINTVGALVTTCAISLSVLATPKIVLAKETGCSLNDVLSYCSFEKELREIKQERNIVFQNSELYNLLNEKSGGKLTIEFLQSITSLIIEEPLSNNDLSDLRYLPNLSNLEISGMKVDCQDLTYNQNLRSCTFANGNISNLNALSNTINSLSLKNTVITDGIVYVPYNTSTLSLSHSTFNKIQFKNPQKITSFTFAGYALLDMNDLKECTNLNYILLNSCPNVSNGHLLSQFPNLSTIKLDDYSCIWLSQNTLSNINLDNSTKKEYSSYIEQLAQIADEITKDCQTEEEKLNAILIYIINKIEYDIRVSEKVKGYDSLVTEYNKSPIYYALNNTDGICVNYACLFTALANKVGIDNYQPSSLTHTWNMVRLENEQEYKAYDAVGLDGPAYTINPDGTITSSDIDMTFLLASNTTDNLYYYSFNLNDVDMESYETSIKPMLISNISKKLGYLRLNNLDACRAQLFVLSAELIALSAILYIKCIIEDKEKEKNTKTLKYKRVKKID